MGYEHGNDTLVGGAGNDYLVGGLGDSTYVFRIGDMTVSIMQSMLMWAKRMLSNSQMTSKAAI